MYKGALGWVHRPVVKNATEGKGFRLSALLYHGVSEGDDISLKQYQGITKTHWETTDYTASCRGQGCHVVFNALLERIHHCRRCGKLYCYRCLSYERRLNDLAQPDPNGKLYKVCKTCFAQGPQSMGATRCQTHEFNRQREKLATEELESGRGDINIINFRDRLDIQQECVRLVAGFQEALSSVPPRSWTLPNMWTAIGSTYTALGGSTYSVPDWQQSSLLQYGQLLETCNECKQEFSLMRKKHNCCICGAAVCAYKPCSSRDLLLYVPDSDVAAHERAQESTTAPSDPADAVSAAVKLAIIKIVGSPETEPAVCIYLRACEQCRSELEEMQVRRYQAKKKTPQAEAWRIMLEQCDNLRTLETQIGTTLPEFHELVEVIDAGAPVRKASTDSQTGRSSHTQSLAKMQGDLSDQLSHFALMIFNLKQVQAATKTQEFMFKNIVRAKCQFYQENMFNFRETQRRLSESTPAEVLNTIQAIVDLNAINSGYVTVKQLALEVFHLCSKHKLEDDLAFRLGEVEEVMYDELKQVIRAKPGENWELHEECMNKLLQAQLRDHRLIKPSRTLIDRFGLTHIRDVITERSAYVVRKVALQLETKCSARQFTRSKAKLTELLEYITGMVESPLSEQTQI